MSPTMFCPRTIEIRLPQQRVYNKQRRAGATVTKDIQIPFASSESPPVSTFKDLAVYYEAYNEDKFYSTLSSPS